MDDFNQQDNTFNNSHQQLAPNILRDDSRELSIKIETGPSEKENLPPKESLFDSPNARLQKDQLKHDNNPLEEYIKPHPANHLDLLTEVKEMLIDKSNAIEGNQPVDSIQAFSQIESRFEESKSQLGLKKAENLASGEDIQIIKNGLSEQEKEEGISNFTRGNEYMEKKKVKKAREKYEKVTANKLLPSSLLFEAWYNLAIAFYYTNRSKAIKCLIEATKINPNESSAFILLGQLCERKQPVKYRYKTSKGYYFKALELDPKNSKLYFIRGNILLDFGHITKAMEMYQIAIENEDLNLSKEWNSTPAPLGADLTQSVLNDLEQDNLPPEANKPHKQLDNDSLTDKKGFELIKSEHSDSDDSFSDSLIKMLDSLKGSYALKASLNLAQVEAQIGHFKKASTILDGVLTNYPEYSKAVYFKYAQLHISQNDFSKAIGILAQVYKLKIQPVSPEVLAREKNVLKKLDESKINPRNKHSKKGHCYIRMGKLDEALKEFEANYALQPEGYIPNWQLVKINVMLGRMKEAEERLAKAHSINPNANLKFKLISASLDLTIKQSGVYK